MLSLTCEPDEILLPVYSNDYIVTRPAAGYFEGRYSGFPLNQTCSGLDQAFGYQRVLVYGGYVFL